MNPNQTPNPNEQNNSQGVQPTVPLNNGVTTPQNTQLLQDSPQPLSPTSPSNQSGPFVSMVSANTESIGNLENKSKTKLYIVIGVIVVILLVVASLFFFVFHKSSKPPLPVVKSVTSKTTKPTTSPATISNSTPSTANVPSCSATSGLTCYNVSASGSIPAFSVLFLSNSTEQNKDGDIDISSPSGASQSILQFSNTNSTTEVPCVDRGWSSSFSFTSNGSSEEACSITGDTATTYVANVNVSGTSYFVTINNPNSSPISESTLETIFSSIKAN